MIRRMVGIAVAAVLVTVVVLAALFLVGCATTSDAPPRVSTITNTVRVPVPIVCLNAADLPARPQPTPLDAQTATTKQLAAAQAADLLALEQWSAIAAALLAQCSKAAP